MNNPENNSEFFENHEAEVVEKKADQSAQLKEQLARMSADFENYKKRTEKDKQLWFTLSKGEVVGKILPFFDELELTFNAMEKELGAESVFVTGVALVMKNMITTLHNIGVEEIKCDIFDPEVHEALSSISVEGKASGKIINIVRRGFKIGEKVIRPAQVVIAA